MHHTKHKKIHRSFFRGFTLVELLLVVSIIGLLATIAVISLSAARTKARDSKRVADMRAIGAGLENYNLEYNGYPDLVNNGGLPPTGYVLGVSNGIALCTGGFRPSPGCLPTETTFLGRIPRDPANTGAYLYTYHSWTDASATVDCTTSTICPWYTLTFTTESAIGNIAAGAHAVTSHGIQ